MLQSCITAILGAVLLFATPWTPPPTPWGDPDLQGTYANNNEYATPLERPAEFDGRRASDLTPAEIAELRRLATQRMIAALPGGDVRGPDEWWLQNLDLTKRSRPWSVVDPPDGRIPPLTPAGAQRASGRVRSSFVGGPFDGPEDLNNLERCITKGVPGVMIPSMYSNNYEILQAPGLVAIRYELLHEMRLIPLDGRPHISAKIRQHLGDSRGHFEGTTLVVETTNLKQASAYRNADVSTLRVVERFTPRSPDVLEWSATLEDPNTWTRPWTFAMDLSRERGGLLFYECHEYNYGLQNILRGARAEDSR
ncbi:MAG TPA: hypothetical protein VKB36_13760 [Vicinamibacterales bacterium]|nr:hypothetical protein [Vicinamibacterales bacterium]